MGLHVPGSAAGQRHCRSIVAAIAAGSNPVERSAVIDHGQRRFVVRPAASVPSASSVPSVSSVPRAKRARRPGRAPRSLPSSSGAVHAGAKVRLALKVSLPEGLHTQSDKPRDPTLIPTVLTLDAPPASPSTRSSFRQRSISSRRAADQPLAVFEQRFAIGVAAVARAATSPAGRPRRPGAGCDTRRATRTSATRRPPPTVQWTLPVGSAASGTNAARSRLRDHSVRHRDETSGG